MIRVEANRLFMLEEDTGISGIVYDGNGFYLTVPGDYKIIKYNESFNQIQCFETNRSYSYLCYDSNDDCFWAVQDGDSSYIYKLNQLFELIDIIYISCSEVRGKRITGISYNYYSDMIFLTFVKVIVAVNKDSFESGIVLYNRNQERIKGLVDLLGGFTGFCVSRLQDKIFIHTYSGKFVTKVIIPYDLRVISLCAGSIENDNNQIHIYVLAIRMNGKKCIPDYLVTNDQLLQQDKYYSNRLDWIASEGEKIANVLDKECEKFGKVMSSSDDREEIMAVTRAICKTIHQAADIEYELYNKLLYLIKSFRFSIR